jgi:hypothetical protein
LKIAQAGLKEEKQGGNACTNPDEYENNSPCPKSLSSQAEACQNNSCQHYGGQKDERPARQRR